ncbi:MAG TPA: cupredoxin family copper-binding protein [Candidatus Eremiobacteraceae bacterium]|jgi:plastocyanin
MFDTHNSKRAVFAALAIVAAVMTAAVTGRTDPMSQATPTPGPTAAPVAVKIVNFAFSPQKVVIPVGGSVTWTNKDDVAHTATASDSSFDSGNLANGQSWTHTFTKAGKYAYICTYHPNMTGTIVVQAATPAPTASSSGY